jgi:hypothetical protein
MGAKGPIRFLNQIETDEPAMYNAIGTVCTYVAVFVRNNASGIAHIKSVLATYFSFLQVIQTEDEVVRLQADNARVLLQ